MLTHYGVIFWELIRTPFERTEMIWGIVPLYFAWLVNELTTSKASFRTAVQTGFSFLWAGAHWSYQYRAERPAGALPFDLRALLAVNVLVTVLVLGVGVVALVSGVRRRYPRHCSFLGHTRFANYFMITIFPLQSQYLAWSWERVLAIVAFAVPVWLVVHVGAGLLRKGK